MLLGSCRVCHAGGSTFLYAINGTTFSVDVEIVKTSILAEITQSRDVVVVAHSYRGAVGQIAVKDLVHPRQGAPPTAYDTSGHVIGLIILSSGLT